MVKQQNSTILCEAFGTAARTLPVGAHLAGPIRAGFTKPWVRGPWDHWGLHVLLLWFNDQKSLGTYGLASFFEFKSRGWHHFKI
jgi:hypothetical protein